MGPDGNDTTLLSPDELRCVGSPDFLHGTAQAHLQKVWRLAGRQLFNTKEGRFGFTSRGVRAGDRVVVLNGSQTPHVVRRVEDLESEQRWKFVGDAYVHALMDGEAGELEFEEKDMIFI